MVTGASRGIGRAIALALAKAGHDLVLVAHTDRAGLEDAAREVRALGASCRAPLCDVASEADVAELFGALGPDAGRLSGLVNNAGYAGERSTLAEMAMSDVDQVLGVNVRGAVLMCRAAIPLLRARRSGAIVNLSSQVAQFGGNGLSVYAASKAALNGLTVSLARELAPDGIRVNAVSPGPVLTDPLKALPAERLEEMRRGLPMGRFCTPEDVAAAVVWLLSDQAGYVSGAIVPVHGAR